VAAAVLSTDEHGLVRGDGDGRRRTAFLSTSAELLAPDDVEKGRANRVTWRKFQEGEKRRWWWAFRG
jgi:hypothetical protein